MKVHFGEFVLDDEQQTLWRSGSDVHLTPKAMQLLLLLLSRRPAVVSRKELYDHLWPDVVVSPERLKNVVSELRHALDDHERRGRFLRNVHGSGYAFAGKAVEQRQSSGVVFGCNAVLIEGDRRHVLWPGENLVGRSEDCNVALDGEEVSRHHARIMVLADEVTVEDLRSRNGTTINDRRIEAPEAIGDGDGIAFGPVQMIIRIGHSQGTTKPRRNGIHRG